MRFELEWLPCFSFLSCRVICYAAMTERWIGMAGCGWKARVRGTDSSCSTLLRRHARTPWSFLGKNASARSTKVISECVLRTSSAWTQPVSTSISHTIFELLSRTQACLVVSTGSPSQTRSSRQAEYLERGCRVGCCMSSHTLRPLPDAPAGIDVWVIRMCVASVQDHGMGICICVLLVSSIALRRQRPAHSTSRR